MFIKTGFSKWCLFAGIIFLITVLNSSCTSTKRVVYFNDLSDSAALASVKTAKYNFENTIQKNDQLWITVGGSNVADLATLNSGNGMGISGMNGNLGTSGAGALLGYLVESDGKIQIPFVGRVQAEGLTRTQLEKKLDTLMSEYTKDPIVNVRFLNYTYYVMGEVLRGGKFNMPTERTTLLEAISTAGDITDLGRRENVAVIREENGERKVGRVNLLSKDLFNSPYYYLRNNDVVYVEPVKAKFISRSGIPQYITLVAVGLTMILTVVNIAGK